MMGSSTLYSLGQWANDWITVHEIIGDRQNIVISPLRATLSASEMERLRADEKTFFEQPDACHSGQFWNAWVLLDTGIFRRRYPSEIGVAGRGIER